MSESVKDFAQKILHGDEDHQKWLLKAADNYCNGSDIYQDNPLKDGKYKLELIIKELGGCNGFGVKAIKEWPDLAPEYDINELIALADKVEESMIATLVDGEESEIKKYVVSNNLFKLENFINHVFDGYLHQKIAYR